MLSNLHLSPEQQETIAATFHKLYTAESVDFSDRLVALKKEQTRIIEEYGREGMMVVLEYEARMYMKPEQVEGLSIVHYTEAPVQCPWFDSRRLPVEKLVADVWRNFRGPFIETLQSNCTDAFVLKAADKWYLIYAFETSHFESGVYTDFLAGREPELHPHFSKELTDQGWHMPGDLKRFYSVHGNLGGLTPALQNTSTYCIASAECLRPSFEGMDAIAKEDNWGIDYSFRNLLSFCDNGSGHSQNFYRIMRNDDSYMTVHWDNESRELGEPKTLADYIDQHFGDMMSHWG